jgi:hypothetical protein
VAVARPLYSSRIWRACRQRAFFVQPQVARACVSPSRIRTHAHQQVNKKGGWHAHKVHHGHAPALRERLAADLLPVQRLVVTVVVFFFLLLVFVRPAARAVLRSSLAAASAHEGDQLGHEIVDVERARASFHRARFGRMHVRCGHEERRVERRFLRRGH